MEIELTESEDVAIAISYTDAKSVLYVTSMFSIEHRVEKPNWWWRFWHYVLLGFKWEDAK